MIEFIFVILFLGYVLYFTHNLDAYTEGQIEEREARIQEMQQRFEQKDHATYQPDNEYIEGVGWCRRK